MPENTPAAPAGWYDVESDPSIQRYWDGTTWTDHTAPKNALPSAPVAMANGASAVAGSGGFASWWRSRSTGVKALLIAAAAVLFLTVVSSVANAAAGGRPSADLPDAKPTVIATPEPEVTEPSEEPSPEPTEEAPKPDATFFKSQVTANVKDYQKDLDDLVTTLDEDGFWRLLTNSVELSFNLGQLQGFEPTDNIADDWNAKLEVLDKQTTKIVDDISDEQYDTLRADIKAADKTCEQLIKIANKAKTS